MTKSALAKITLLGVVSTSACSLFVNADRSSVEDDLYQPSVIPEDDAGDAEPGDAGEDAAEDAAEDAGAAGAAGAGDSAAAAGAAGASG
jgi:hypothetical protein